MDQVIIKKTKHFIFLKKIRKIYEGYIKLRKSKSDLSVEGAICKD